MNNELEGSVVLSQHLCGGNGYPVSVSRFEPKNLRVEKRLPSTQTRLMIVYLTQRLLQRVVCENCLPVLNVLYQWVLLNANNH